MLKKTIFTLLLSFIPLSAFTAEEETEGNNTTHFVGASLYYDYVKYKAEATTLNPTPKAPKFIDIDSGLGGLAFTYKYLNNNFLLALNLGGAGAPSAKDMAVGNANAQVINYTIKSDLELIFNGLISFINKDSGIFIGGGLGGGALVSANDTSYSFAAADAYHSVIGNIGFMHTLDDIPFMYDITLGYSYNLAYGDVYTQPVNVNYKSDNWSDWKVKVGLHYAIK